MKPEAMGGTRGVSLLELVVVLAIFGLMALLVGPAVGNQSRRARVQTGAEQLAADLERARSEALKRSATVTLEVTGSDGYTIDFIGDRELEGVTFASAPSEVEFAPLGPQNTGAAAFVLESGDYSRTVRLTAAGFAYVED